MSFHRTPVRVYLPDGEVTHIGDRFVEGYFQGYVTAPAAEPGAAPSLKAIVIFRETYAPEGSTFSCVSGAPQLVDLADVFFEEVLFEDSYELDEDHDLREDEQETRYFSENAIYMNA